MIIAGWATLCGFLRARQSHDLQYKLLTRAKVAELADAPDLGSGAARRGGSSPPFRTNNVLNILRRASLAQDCWLVSNSHRMALRSDTLFPVVRFDKVLAVHGEDRAYVKT
jgi:hypothetical protein